MILIFSGYNQRAVVAFLRYLKEYRLDNYGIFASSDKDSILLTEYKEKILYIRKNKELNLNEIISAIDGLGIAEGILIVPSTESLNRFVLHNKKTFEDHGCIIPLVSEELYKTISDKNRFWNVCLSEGFDVPETVNLTDEYEYKYVAKPKEYMSVDKMTYSPVLVDSKEKHDHFLKNYVTEYFDIQEYIEGESYYLLYYADLNGNIFSFSQRNILQQKNGKSILAAISSGLHDKKISDRYKDLIRKLSFYGFIMIELRKKGNKYFMIEANPRFWGPSQLLVDANVDFFGRFLNDYGLELDLKKRSEYSDKNFYYWGGGRAGDEVWLDGGKELFVQNEELFYRADIYNRADTKELYLSEFKR